MSGRAGLAVLLGLGLCGLAAIAWLGRLAIDAAGAVGAAPDRQHRSVVQVDPPHHRLLGAEDGVLGRGREGVVAEPLGGEQRRAAGPWGAAPDPDGAEASAVAAALGHDGSDGRGRPR